jgi:hypothetical protein
MPGAAQMLSLVWRSMRVSRREFLKKYRVFLPFSGAAHRVFFSVKMSSLRRKVGTHNVWSNPTKLLVFSGIPKAASMAMNAQLTETFGDFFQGGGYLYARDLSALKRGAQHSISHAVMPKVIGIGHQSPRVLIESRLISTSHAREVPLVCILRPDDERFRSGLRYCYSNSLLPSSLSESETRKMLARRGFAPLKSHDTSLNWGVPIHFSPTSHWLHEGSSFNLQTFDIRDLNSAMTYIRRFHGLPCAELEVPIKNSTHTEQSSS